ncbi:transporter substrate-binding domain-containing protein [Aeromicrobium sp. CF3.5]|uniref:transporter substrate-binding domain-containing protein n=1 Tax=Aeromicrobium sp. CF3.5 TaxID=3373078 RepID=UPI003EE64B78
MNKLTILSGGLLAAVLLGGCASEADPAESADQGLTEVDTSAPLYDQLPAAVQERGELVFAGDSHPPYRTVGSDGSSVTGIDPDIQAALSEQLGVPIRIELANDLSQTITGMGSGRYDAFNGPVKATPERLADFDGVSWLTSRTSYLIPLDGGIDADDAAGLCGTTAAGVTASITEEQTAKLSDWCTGQGDEPVKFLGLADTNATILAVQSGRAQSVATTQTGALDVIAQQEDTWRYVTQTDEQGAGVDQLVVLTPKSANMGEVMLEAFQGIFESGEYADIVEQYGLDDVSVEAPVLNPEVE